MTESSAKHFFISAFQHFSILVFQLLFRDAAALGRFFWLERKPLGCYWGDGVALWDGWGGFVRRLGWVCWGG
jgi:hypothetical protein